MKNIKSTYILLAGLLLAQSCAQDVIKLEEPEVTPDTSCEDAVTGTANFAKFVAVGNSFVAGFQAGALFTDGQNKSLAAILNKQFECVGAPADFKQPTIGASLGWNLFVTQPFLTDNTKPIYGRMLLQYNGAASPLPTPQAYAPGNREALPNPTYNPGFIYGDGSTKAALNNFGIPAIFLGQSLIPETGAWAGAGTDPRFSPFYGRLAYPGTGSTLIGDAALAGGSFFFLWLGLDDFFLYAAYGGDYKLAPLTNATGGTQTDFDFQYGAAVGSLLGSNSSLKGVVANFPNIFAMPHFTAVAWNVVALDEAHASALNSGYEDFNGGIAAYNAGLLPGQSGVPTKQRPTINFVAGNNGIVITDSDLPDLTAYGIPSMRQTTSSDIIPLAAGSVIGTLVNDDPNLVNGVSVPLADRYAIVPSERDSILAARTAFNNIVKATADTYPTKLAFADVDAALNTLVTNHAAVMNGVTITPNIDPPTGIYSEDGVHPNTRGYAFLSTVIIQAINAKFGSTIPLTNIANYGATALPIP